MILSVLLTEGHDDTTDVTPIMSMALTEGHDDTTDVTPIMPWHLFVSYLIVCCKYW